MDAQFEIHSHLEKKHYVEYYRYIWRKRIVAVVIFAVLGVVLLAVHLLADDYYLFAGIWGVAYAIWLYFRPWMEAAKHVKRETKFEGTETIESVTKFGDVLQDETKSQTVSVPYEKLEAIHVAKYVIILTDARKMAFILEKNGFVKGTLEEFLPFIQEKCPQLKLPKW